MKTKAKPRSPYHHGDLPHALLEAAVDLIAREGGESFTLRELARVVGVTHGAVYRHFEDKRALLALVSEQGFRALAEKMRASIAALPEQDTIARLRVLATTYVEFAIEHPGYYRTMSGPRLNEDLRFPSLENAITEGTTLLSRELSRGQANGVIRAGSVRDLGVALWTMAHGYSSLVLMRRIRTKSKKLALDYFLTLLTSQLDGLRT